VQFCGSASFDADPDPTIHFDADPTVSGSTTIQDDLVLKATDEHALSNVRKSSLFASTYSRWKLHNFFSKDADGIMLV
jgi:hypothetical protein